MATSKHRRIRAALVALIAAIPAISGCPGEFPIRAGKVLIITNDDEPLLKTDPKYATTLQVRWLGTACHHIQLGDTAVLTDPFFSYHDTTDVAFGEIESDVETVSKKIEDLPVARAIFIGHSHYDHMLDLPAAMRFPGWEDVPVHGSMTTRNILNGYGPDVVNRWEQVRTDEQWRPAGDASSDSLEYMAVLSEHAPQLGNTLLYPGKVEEPLTAVPDRADEFKVGETYAYFFKLSGNRESRVGSRREDIVFTVYFVGSASNGSEGLPESDLSVDVAILCVPGWRNVEGYPREVIQRLRPRYIILSHFDNFLEDHGGSRAVVPSADLRDFLNEVQDAADYPEFKSIRLPAVDTIQHFKKPKVTRLSPQPDQVPATQFSRDPKGSAFQQRRRKRLSHGNAEHVMELDSGSRADAGR